MNEITFNAALLREFRAIEFVRRLKADGRLQGTDYSNIRMHRIAGDEALVGLSAASKLYAELGFLEDLRDLGRAAAEDFLEEHFSAIGEHATLDLTEELSPDVLPQAVHKKPGRRMRDLIPTFQSRHKN